ncbi:MAG: ABC transporter permease [Chloroflexi bacterium]|nr:ABC transporter permease [Chloroflexota bacterium]
MNARVPGARLESPERPGAEVPAPVRRKIEDRGFVAATWLRLRQDPIAMAALVGLVLIGIVSAAAPVLSGLVPALDPVRQDLFNRYAPPNTSHWLGTDDLGRDAFARLLNAGQVSIGIGFCIAVVTMLIGIPVGLVSGFFGGRVDDISNAVIQTLQNTPTLFLLILLSVTLRPPPLLLAVIIGLLGWTDTARQVRGLALAIREREYVTAARVMGASNIRIMSQHILPNIFSIVTVVGGFSMAGGILVESGLSYLGLGIQPPTPSWGNMLNNSLDNVTRAPWLVAGPGVAIFLTTLGIFLLADGVRDAMDPRVK